MKKGLVITLIVLVIFILISFAIFIILSKDIYNESKSDITMTIQKGTLTRTSVTIIIKDDNKEHTYGEDYSIEEKKNGEWKPVKQTGTYFVNAVSWSSATGKLKFNLNWSERYGELENGEYRIVKSVHTTEGERKLYAEFSIE